jgi:hypothetical protein
MRKSNFALRLQPSLLEEARQLAEAEGVALLHANAELPRATELPGHVAAAHHAYDLTANLVLDRRPPRDEAEAEPVIDHRKIGRLRVGLNR